MSDNPTWGSQEQPAPPYDAPPTAAPAYGAPPADPYGGEVLTTPEPRKRRGVFIGTLSALLVLIAGAGVYVTAKLAGGGTQPEELAPAGTFAFAKVDLDPAASQKLAIREFASHFPGAPKADGDDMLEQLVAEALSAGGDVDYERDVEPWIGKRGGVGGFAAASGSSVAFAVLQVEDEAKARDALPRIAAEAKQSDGEFAWRIERGYAVLSSTTAVVDEIVTAAGKESLAENEQFEADVDSLTGDQVFVAWADLAKAFAAARSADPSLGVLPNGISDQFRGRVVVGGHAAGDYVEIEGKLFGNPQTELLRNAAPKLLTDLPADTVGAVAFNNLHEFGRTTLEQVSGLGFDPDQMLGELQGALGIDIRDDLLPLLGKEAVIALGSSPLGFEMPEAGLRSVVGDPERARAAGLKLEALGTRFGIPLHTRVDGNTFVLALNEPYGAALAKDGALGEDATFRKAMGELGDEVAGALYFNFDRALEGAPADGVPPDLAALRAIGVSVGKQGGDAYFRLRVVAGK